MKSIKYIFRKLHDVSLVDVLNYYGVYVIWDSQANQRPTYIGFSENVAHRLAKHDITFAKPFGGYIALFEYRDDALLVESLLIDIARETDRIQKYNEKSGHLKLLNEYFEEHGKIKISINNYSPFDHPNKARKLTSAKMIIVEEEDYYSDDFRKRRAA